MIVQKVMLPHMDICPNKALYIRESRGAEYDLENRTLSFSCAYSICRFDTYYNSFSVMKWKQYCQVTKVGLHLNLEGEFFVEVIQANVTEKKDYYEIPLIKKKFTNETTIEFDVEKIDGVLYFTLECLSDSGKFIYADYYVVDEPAREVKICMGVCTFRREEFILGNLDQIQSTIFDNPDSPCRDKLDIIVSDNGQTLPLDRYNEHIKIVQNKNLGGAGGFTRCMVEMLNVQEKEQYTHILLTDDDIKIEPLVIERLYMLLCYLKEECREAFVGGSMFRTDAYVIQNEMANRWQAGKVVPLNYKKSMADFKTVVLNELPVNINYFSWWFCAMPVGIIQKYNLPLPIFIKRDDIEYGLRNGSMFITINGINVWHEPFESKRPAYLEYYYIRNQYIMECTFARNASRKSVLNNIKRRLIDDVSKFHYLEFKFFCEGVIDFCKGIDFLKSLDAVALNDSLRQRDRTFLPLEELPIEFNQKEYNSSLAAKDTPRDIKMRKLTLNGWLLPSKKNPIIVQAAFPTKKPFYRAKVALNVENISQKGYISYKSWSSLFECVKLYLKTTKMVKKYYRPAVREYINRWRELINIDFWDNYLFGEPVPTTKETPAIETKQKFDIQHQKDYYVHCLDTKKVNPRVIYLESRKGTDFASNIFAVAKELQSKEYKNFKIYLSYTDDSKKVIQTKIRQNKLRNITLIEKDGKKFIEVMATAKYFFTDFHLFPYFAKRKDQVIVSLWHGTPLKTLGKDCKTETQASVQRIFNIADYQVYPGKFMEEKMIDVYWQENIYKGKILETGYPRNALFFDEQRRKEIRDELKLNDKQVIMYMPTFRGAAGNNLNDKQSEIIANYFDELDLKLKDNQIFYIKLHNYNSSRIDCSKYKHIIEAPSQYDNYELQNACDLLITDYSSVFFDFAVSRRKIILFQYDQEEYLSTRGVCIPLEELPFPIVLDVDSLVKEINSPIAYDDKEFLEKYATFDNENATKMLCSHVLLNKELPQGYNEKTLQGNGKKNVFIYTGDLRTRQDALAFWDHINKLDFDNANYFLLYYDPVMWKNAYRLLPMSNKCNQIGMWSYESFTTKEKKFYDKYVINRDISSSVKEVLDKLYQREIVKHFGNDIQIDAVILWNVVTPSLGNMFDKVCENKYVVYPDEFGIYDKALVDSLSNYQIVYYSEFNEVMANAPFVNNDNE